MLSHNFDKLYRSGERFKKAFKKTLLDSAGEAMDILAIHAFGNMINPGGYGEPVDPKRITSRSGRTARSLMPQMGAFRPGGGKREQVRKVTIAGDKIIITFGSEVPYLATHEYGASIGAFEMAVTPKMSSFFWAKYYETGDEKFKAMALSTTIKQPAKTIGKRPVLEPAARQSVREIEALIKMNMEELVYG